MSLPLLLATSNTNKISEIRAILSPHIPNLVTARDLGLTIDVSETGKTYAENAKLKAFAFQRASGLPALADDTGLEVDALQGAPGIYSNRFSPKNNPTYVDHRQHLIDELKNKRNRGRSFVVSMILALPDGNFFEATGRREGIIVPEESGSNGLVMTRSFVSEYGVTMAELPPHKNQISHRKCTQSHTSQADPAVFRTAQRLIYSSNFLNNSHSLQPFTIGCSELASLNRSSGLGGMQDDQQPRGNRLDSLGYLSNFRIRSLSQGLREYPAKRPKPSVGR